MAVTRKTLNLQQQLRDELRKVADQQTRDLVSAYADAWDEIAPDLNAALLEQLVSGDRVTKAQLLRSMRLRKALVVIGAQLRTLTAEAGVRITADLEGVVDAAGGAQSSILDSQLPPGHDLINLDQWSRVDERQIAAIVRRSTEQITSTLKPVSAQSYAAVRAELVRGVAAGSNPRATAARMVQRAEGQFTGGLQRALVIARTEIPDAHRDAARLGMEQHADVLRGWIWLAQLGARTCPSCWAQHGGEHPLSEPGPLDHQCGRCTRMAVAKSWADLGFDIEEPASMVPDAAESFMSLSVKDQREVLGPARYDAFVAGNFPMESWSVRKSTDGWRDSFHVAPAPQSGGLVSRNAA